MQQNVKVNEGCIGLISIESKEREVTRVAIKFKVEGLGKDAGKKNEGMDASKGLKLDSQLKEQ